MPASESPVFRHLPRISVARLVLLATAAIVIYFLVAGAFTAVRSNQLRQEETRLRAEVEQLQRRYQRLEALRDYLNSDEYIELIAREELGLVREGEIGLVVISTAPTPTPEPDQQTDLWWEALIR